MTPTLKVYGSELSLRTSLGVSMTQKQSQDDVSLMQ